MTGGLHTWGAMRAVDLAVSDAVDWDHEEAAGGVYDVVDDAVDSAADHAIDLAEIRAAARRRVRQ